MISQLIEFAKNNEVFAGLVGGAGLSYVLYAVRAVPAKIGQFIGRMFMTTVTVRSDNEAFGWIADWIGQHPTISKARSLKIVSGSDQYFSGDHQEIGSSVEGFRLTLGEGVRHMIFFGLRPCFVTRVRIKEMNEPADEIIFRFLGRSHDPIDLIVNEAYKLRQSRECSGVHMTDGYYWQKHGHLSPRDPETIFLDEGCERLLWSSLDNFLHSKEKYRKRGTIWKYGVLLYGPPGTGKSSIIRAIATKYRREIHYISLGSIRDDESLIKLFSNTQTGALIVIEDIDTFDAMKKRTSEKAKIAEKNSLTTAGILNALDGALSQEGNIVIMTSNNKDFLDAAIFRPGRVDLDLYIGYATPYQIQKMYAFYADRDIDHGLLDVLSKIPDLTTAEIHAAMTVDNFDEKLHDLARTRSVLKIA